VEHEAFLSIISDIPDAFYASESLPQWETGCKWMVTQFYQTGTARLSGTLNGHLWI